jgi:hypothetical protein
MNFVHIFVQCIYFHFITTGNYSAIRLDNNQLTQFESSAFQSTLETMEINKNGYVSLRNSNDIFISIKFYSTAQHVYTLLVKKRW